MTRTDIQSAVSAELHRIAPEIAIDDIDRRADLREEFDIDSMDFLTLVTCPKPTIRGCAALMR